MPRKTSPSSPQGAVPADSSSFCPSQAPTAIGTATMNPTWPRIAAFERAPPGVGGAAKWVESSRGGGRERIGREARPGAEVSRLEPAPMAEVPRHARGREDHQRHAAEEDVDVVEGHRRKVHAKETGEQREDEEHGRDAREHLHDLVEAIRS